MAQFLAAMQSALQLLPANPPAMCLLEVARLAVNLFLATSAPFLNQERALGAGYVSSVTVVLDGRMSTAGPSETVETAVWRPGTARLRGVKDCPAAVATDFGEDGFWAVGTWATVADLLALVTAALQLSTACLDANVLCFDRCYFTGKLMLSSSCLSLSSLLFACTAVLSALVTTAAQVGLANSHTHGALNIALMADAPRACPATYASNLYSLVAESTISGMALGGAQVPTR